MSVPRAATLRVLSAWQASRASARPRLNWRRWQQFVRRTYASHEGHDSAKSGSDLPWLLGSITITAPAAFYLYNSGPHGREHGEGPTEHSEEEGSREDGSGTSDSAENPSNEAQEGPQAESEDGTPEESEGVEGKSKGDLEAPKHEDNSRQEDPKDTSPAHEDDHKPSQEDKVHSP
ncbi:hypothetical protein Egran_01210 [Elaphomyces granulatus]|uniref:Uncharacterized protein n=1 Tax=Elaphomyces granulatus TaxID=519963 RepID=A0A232M3P3_9EURO|nr:hypothetical protein Egran_01210 [Elaphomyces granulatus]